MEISAAMKRLEEALAEHYGWSAHPVTREKVNQAVASKAARLGIEPQEYCRIAAGSQSELLALVEEASTGQTHFFREPDQFACLRARILPELIAASPGNEKVRLWSTACSTGDEAYSLAISFDQARPEESERQVEVFATDVRNSALLAASQARYRSSALGELDGQVKAKYFETAWVAGEEQYTLIPDIRRVVVFRRVNLLDRLFWKGVAGKFDLIVCSNQLLYLHSTAARQMVGNLVNSIRAGGYLMVAPSEVDLVNSSDLTQLPESPTFFRRNRQD